MTQEIEFDKFLTEHLSKELEENGFRLTSQDFGNDDTIYRRYESEHVIMAANWEPRNVVIQFRSVFSENEHYWNCPTLRFLITGEPILFRACLEPVLLIDRFFWYETGNLQFLKQHFDDVISLLRDNYDENVEFRLAQYEQLTYHLMSRRDIPYAPFGVKRPAWVVPSAIGR